MGDVVDVAFDDINRCCNGCQIMMGGENNLHRTGGTTNPNKMWNSIFCKSTKFGAGLPGFLGLLKLEFHLDSTKNTSADLTFVS